MLSEIRPVGRIPGLDGLRGLAAVWVMLFHFHFIYLPAANLIRPLELDHAYLSVDLFFIMSGYVMAHVYGQQMISNWREAWKPFVLARFGRIYPLFILTLAVLVAIYASGHLASNFVSFSPRALALQPFMLQPWHHGMNWNYPSWSIGTEMAAYAVFILAARPLLIGRHPLLIATALAGTIAVICFAKHGRVEVASQAPAYIRTFAGFGLGVLLFRAIKTRRDFTREMAISFIGPFVAAAIILQSDIFSYGIIVCVIVLAVTGSFRVLNWKPFCALGDWSYGIYLWHAPVSFAIMAWAAANNYHLQSLSLLQTRELFVATSILTVGISGLVYHFFEVPARRGIRASFERRVQAHAAAQ